MAQVKEDAKKTLTVLNNMIEVKKLKSKDIVDRIRKVASETEKMVKPMVKAVKNLARDGRKTRKVRAQQAEKELLVAPVRSDAAQPQEADVLLDSCAATFVSPPWFAPGYPTQDGRGPNLVGGDRQPHQQRGQEARGDGDGDRRPRVRLEVLRHGRARRGVAPDREPWRDHLERQQGGA